MRFCAGLLLVICATSVGVAAEPMESAAPEAASIGFGETGGLPRVLEGRVALTWRVPGDDVATATLRKLRYALVDEPSNGSHRITLRAIDPYQGAYLTQRYIVRGAHVIEMQLEVPAGGVVEVAALPTFAPEPLPGFGAAYGDVRAVAVDDEGQRNLESGAMARELSAWVGVRNRFATALLEADRAVAVTVVLEIPNEPRVRLQPAGSELALRLYAGPVEKSSLAEVDPRLTGMLFAALWDWLRWLCFAMLWLLTTIHGFVGNIGAAIVLLSLLVKVMMLPLTQLADRLQASVNRTQALLQPQLDEIKRHFKGEEAHERTLAVYKDAGVSPLYTLKSLLGFLIQIPVFIAAFDMLGENIALAGGTFLWIDDLAKPDQWLALPLVVPFFGGYLNLLPCLMTGVTLLTSWLQTDPNLTPALLRAQQRRLYVMAGAFFLLFFTFPAGMVLYWTTNNVIALAKVGLLASIGYRRSGA
jgi:YidC/Oxa1 family membrane protein insertase